MVKRKKLEKSEEQWIADLDLSSTYARKSAMIALAGNRSEAALIPLQNIARGQDASLRACAAWALAEIGDLQSAETLENLLKDMDTEVRRAAARGLSQLANPSSRAALLDASMDSDRWVASEALKGLESLVELKPKRKTEILELKP